MKTRKNLFMRVENNFLKWFAWGRAMKVAAPHGFLSDHLMAGARIS